MIRSLIIWQIVVFWITGSYTFPINRRKIYFFPVEMTSSADQQSSHSVQHMEDSLFSYDDINLDYTKPLWEVIRKKSSQVAREDLQASVLMSNSILSQKTFEEAMSGYLAIQLEGQLLPATQIKTLFMSILSQNTSISKAWALDLLAAAIRDNKYPNIADIMLFSKGFHALASYRMANVLWYSGRDELARFFQSLISRVFGADVHPAASIGRGCYFASGSHVVIGETAVVGDDCWFDHGVTLGGTGKESGDRHPKLSPLVTLSPGATVLGNIQIGQGCIIEAESVVTKSTKPYARYGGIPAKELGEVPPASRDRGIGEVMRDLADCRESDSFDLEAYRRFCNVYLEDLDKLRGRLVFPNERE